MDINKTLGSRAVVVVIVLIVLLPFVYSVVRSVFAQSAPGPDLFLEKAVIDNAGGDQSKCVIETQFGLDARYQHMDFLKATRDDAMRAGKRGEVGIKSCQQCHQTRENFCNQCHKAVNLNLDAGCFRCHYYPSRKQPSP